MKVYVNEITGIADAIVSMYMSKRTWNRELECHIRDVCDCVLTCKGGICSTLPAFFEKHLEEFNKWIDTLTKWGPQHITMLKFIDFSITVEGLHRAGQDDWDSHAKRFDNRIIRSSTRLADFDYEMSDYYKGKIIFTDQAMGLCNIPVPNEIQIGDYTFVKTVNGYIREDLKDNKDVKRGLYMLSIPSNFIFKVNLSEFAHVYKERNKNGTANPEVKECCEAICDQLEEMIPAFNRELFARIKN